MIPTPNFRRLVLLSAVLAVPAHAQSFENLERLDNRVAAALGAMIGEPGGAMRPIDRRLRLAPCPEPAVVGEPIMGAVAVRCDSLGWRIRVPLVASGGAGVAVVTAPPPPRGRRRGPAARRR